MFYVKLINNSSQSLLFGKIIFSIIITIVFIISIVKLIQDYNIFETNRKNSETCRDNNIESKNSFAKLMEKIAKDTAEAKKAVKEELDNREVYISKLDTQAFDLWLKKIDVRKEIINAILKYFAILSIFWLGVGF